MHNHLNNNLEVITIMKKTIIAVFSACLIFSASSAVYAAPVSEKEMHMKKVDEKKKHNMHVKKMEEKKKHKMHAKSLHAKSIHTKKAHEKSIHAKSLKAKSLKAKEITKMPKTGFGGASEQAE